MLAAKEEITFMFYLLFCCYLLLTSLGLLLIKLGGSGTNLSLEPQTFSLVMSYRLVIGLLCYICSFLLFTFILQKRNLSMIYPLSAGIVNVVSVVLGVVVLKEKITLSGALGIALVIAGVILMSLKR